MFTERQPVIRSDRHILLRLPLVDTVGPQPQPSSSARNVEVYSSQGNHPNEVVRLPRTKRPISEP